MTAERKFITWQPVLTDHQAFTFQALAQEAGIPVVAYVSTLEDSVRKAQGWTDTQVTSVDRYLIPKRGFLRYCYHQLHKHRAEIHLFGSPFQQPRLMICILLAAWLRIEFYLISEPYSPGVDSYLSDTVNLLGRFKTAFRPWVYRAYVFLIRDRVAGIFAISKFALTQYAQAGMPWSKLFPFGYFIPAAKSIAEPRVFTGPVKGRNLRIIFVGSLIRRKGIDLLQEAVLHLHEQGYLLKVDIYGPGDESSLLHSCPAISYCGTIPFGDAQGIISEYDLLVLPSRYDGWGVVVNEALCAGVPVVCSDMTGAGNVAESLGAGLTFNSGDESSLSDVLLRLLGDPSLLAEMRIAASCASLTLQPVIAARYMLEIVRAPVDRKSNLPSPWYPDRV